MHWVQTLAAVLVALTIMPTAKASPISERAAAAKPKHVTPPWHYAMNPGKHVAALTYQSPEHATASEKNETLHACQNLLKQHYDSAKVENPGKCKKYKKPFDFIAWARSLKHFSNSKLNYCAVRVWSNKDCEGPPMFEGGPETESSDYSGMICNHLPRGGLSWMPECAETEGGIWWPEDK